MSSTSPEFTADGRPDIVQAATEILRDVEVAPLYVAYQVRLTGRQAYGLAFAMERWWKYGSSILQDDRRQRARMIWALGSFDRPLRRRLIEIGAIDFDGGEATVPKIEKLSNAGYYRLGPHGIHHALADKEGGWICHYCRQPVLDMCDLDDVWVEGFKGVQLKPGIAARAASVDHVIPRSKGGTDAPQNLVLACRSCNSSKGNREAPAA
jgi:hypothetical protein